VIVSGIENKMQKYNKMQKEKLTVLITYRDREENLKVFIPYFHNFMNRCFLDIPYEIVIIEQGNDKPFNKGILYNAGFLITSGNTDYYALHDIDVLPISANYYYKDKPHNILVNSFEQDNSGNLKNPLKDKYNYTHSGGVNIISKNDYMGANGHSNNYWGWGCEDDDFKIRLNFSGIGLYRIGNNTNDNGYFISLNSKSDRFNNNEHYNHNQNHAKKLLDKKIDWKTEGLNTTKFTITDKKENNNYIKYIIDFKNDTEK